MLISVDLAAIAPNRPRAGAERSLRSNNNKHSGGFPHSDIPGSKGALASPGLIAECHVLHRLLLPRHPPNALIALDPIQKKTGPFAWQRFICQPIPNSWSEVFLTRRRRYPGRHRRRQRPCDRRRLLGQCHRLGKTVLVVLPLRCLRTGSPNRQTPGRIRTPTRAGPKTSRVFALFTMSIAGCRHPAPSICLVLRSDRQNHRAMVLPIGSSVAAAVHPGRLVEPTGIEPVTSCLQSTRSPS